MNKKTVNWNRNGVHTTILEFDPAPDPETRRLARVTGYVDRFRGVAEFDLKATTLLVKQNVAGEQSNTEIPGMRGTIYLRGNDGYILQMRGRDLELRRKEIVEKGNTPPPTDDGIRHRQYAISRQIVVKSINEDVVFERIIRTAKELNDKYARSVDLDGNTLDNEGRTLRRLVLCHKTAYLSTLPGKKESKDKTGRLLDALSGSSISDLDVEMLGTSELNRLLRENERHAKELLRTGQLFLQYCIQNRYSHCANPFDNFILERSGQTQIKQTESLIRKTIKPKSLGIKSESELKDMISSAKAIDVRYTALLIVMEFGLAATSVAKLRWQDIVFTSTEDGVQVQLRFIKEHNAGATHNYMRPGTRFAARELKRRYDELKSAFGDKISEMRLVKRLVFEGERVKELTLMKPGDITSFCKKTLHESGIKNNDLKKDSNKAMGTGTRLLLANYKDRLINRCGFGDGDASECFMMGASMRFDTTADNYRCFVDEEGQHHLQIMLNRDASSELPVDQSQVLTVKPWGQNGQHILARAKELSRFNHIEFQVELTEEDEFLVIADGGLELYVEPI